MSIETKIRELGDRHWRTTLTARALPAKVKQEMDRLALNTEDLAYIALHWRMQDKDFLAHLAGMTPMQAQHAAGYERFGTEDKMIFVAGSTTSFRCNCGGNVFRESVDVASHYRCNSCNATYSGSDQDELQEAR